MRTTEPSQDCPPDEIIGKISITALFDPDDGVWSVYCPQWKCELHESNLTRCVTILVAEIETHNQEILQGEPSWHKDPKKMAEAAYLGVDHESAQEAKRKTAILDAHSKRSAAWNRLRQGK